MPPSQAWRRVQVPDKELFKKRIAAAEYGLKMYTTKISSSVSENFASTSEKCPIQKGSGLEETAKFDLRRARSSDDHPIVSLPKNAKESISIDRVCAIGPSGGLQDRAPPTARQSPHVARGGLSRGRPSASRAAAPLWAAHRLDRARHLMAMLLIEQGVCEQPVRRLVHDGFATRRTGSFPVEGDRFCAPQPPVRWPWRTLKKARLDAGHRHRSAVI
jgi:hypothetical protein